MKLYTFLNPYSYLLARKEKELFSHFNIYIDGIALVKILHWIGYSHIERKSFDMTSLAPEVFDNAIEKDKTVYFIGTKPGIIDKAVENIRENFPKLRIIGYRDGYIDPEERASVLEEIVQKSPDIVICGMGTPLQERFLVNLQNRGWKGIGYTCGGFLHQTAQGIKYYPDWINRYNLRWLYRIYDEPKLFKRYAWEYPKFVFIFIADFLRYKFKKSPNVLFEKLSLKPFEK